MILIIGELLNQVSDGPAFLLKSDNLASVQCTPLLQEL